MPCGPLCANHEGTYNDAFKKTHPNLKEFITQLDTDLALLVKFDAAALTKTAIVAKRAGPQRGYDPETMGAMYEYGIEGSILVRGLTPEQFTQRWPGKTFKDANIVQEILPCPEALGRNSSKVKGFKGTLVVDDGSFGDIGCVYKIFSRMVTYRKVHMMGPGQHLFESQGQDLINHVMSRGTTGNEDPMYAKVRHCARTVASIDAMMRAKEDSPGGSGASQLNVDQMGIAEAARAGFSGAEVVEDDDDYGQHGGLEEEAVEYDYDENARDWDEYEADDTEDRWKPEFGDQAVWLRDRCGPRVCTQCDIVANEGQFSALEDSERKKLLQELKQYKVRYSF